MINNLKFLFFTLFFLCCSLEAAAPGSHLLFAKRWLYAHGISDQNCQDEFIVGTLFPDIRYLGTIKRSVTHVKGVNKDDILNANSYFRAGFLLHSFVDEKREQFVEKYKIHNKLNFIPKKMRAFFLKLLEDEIIWEQLNLTQVQKALCNIYPEEVAMGVDYEALNEWHSLMITYFNQKPSVFLSILKEQNLGFLSADPKTIADWSEILPILTQDPYYIEYTQKLINHLEKLFP